MGRNQRQKGQADLVVVGSGVAGLTSALAAADRGATVSLLAAGSLRAGSSWWAQGGIAAAVAGDDSLAFHEADTLAVGAGMNDRSAVSMLVRDGRTQALALLNLGVPFERSSMGEPLLGLEAGHTHRRILHAGGGATGRLVSEALLRRVLRHERIKVMSQTAALSLVVDNHGHVSGVQAGRGVFSGRAVVLATGGYAGLWARTTNPVTNCGQGLELAWRAGATLADLEFVQFHPTALDLPGAPAYLLSEALRGEGARLVNRAGDDVANPLLPRDVVARALYRYCRDHGQAYLSLRHLDPTHVHASFPAIAARLHGWGLDLARDLLPVSPAAHYCMGGIRTDSDGRTDVPGLYAAGEVACTGVQGANRLASNSLLECLVFGTSAALAAISDGEGAHAGWSTRPLETDGTSSDGYSHTPCSNVAFGERLEHDLGVERNGQDLGRLAMDLPLPLDTIYADHAGAAEAGAPQPSLVAALAARSALLRTESRGAHYRTDYPQLSASWRGHILWQRGHGTRFEEVSE